MKVLVLNFSHPLSEEQVLQIERMVGPVEVREVAFQIDFNMPFAPQVAAAVDAVGLPPEEFQKRPIIVNPPGLSAGTACLLAEIHGRCGHFPMLLVMKREAGPVPRYVVAEVLDLQSVREEARGRRRQTA